MASKLNTQDDAFTPEAVDAALFAIHVATSGLPLAKARRRLDRMEAAAFEIRKQMMGRANIYRLRGGGTRDQMDAARLASLRQANAFLEASRIVDRILFGDETAPR